MKKYENQKRTQKKNPEAPVTKKAPEWFQQFKLLDTDDIHTSVSMHYLHFVGLFKESPVHSPSSNRVHTIQNELNFEVVLLTEHHKKKACKAVLTHAALGALHAC